MYRWIVFSLLAAMLLVAGCSEERGSAPLAPGDRGELGAGSDAEALAWALVREAGWPIDEDLALTQPDPQCHGQHGPLLNFERTQLVGDVFHYYVEIPTGAGMYDKIGLHRVVRESRPYRPIHTRKSVFYQHGDCKDFVGMVLPGLVGPTTPIDFGMAVYLAQNDVDVWGIDQSWCFVPLEETEFGFMTDWNLQFAVDNLDLGLSVARFTRAVTGNGMRKMNLCGYSSGVWTSYALLNQETQTPRGLRNVGGFIPVDAPNKTDDEDLRELFCADAQWWPPQPQWTFGFMELGLYALSDPGGHFFDPNLTNEQFALYQVAVPMFFNPGFHYNAGVFDEEEIPYDLQYTDKIRLFEFLASAIIWQPTAFMRDYDRVVCNEEDVPYDDYLSEITVPIYDVTCAGGFRQYMFYAATLTGSQDVSQLLVRLHPEGEEGRDFGHIDLFSANDAPFLVWQPILEWIEGHSH